MNGINKVILIGSVGREPEIKATANGVSIADFSIATNEKYKDKRTGEMQETTEWHSLVAFGKLAEIVAQYLTKGSLIYIEGKNKTESWEDKQTGEKKYKTKVYVHQMQMLSGKGKQDSQQGNAHPNQTGGVPANPQAAQPSEDAFDDIPF